MGIEVPFNRPTLEGPELEYIRQAIASGHIGGNGAFTRRCERLLERELGVPKVLLTTSGTHALELAALLLDVRPGDEVIVPSFTFPSTANAFALRGARIVFSDICADTLTLDPSNLERLLTRATRVVVPMHYGGVACEMTAICERQPASMVSRSSRTRHTAFSDVTEASIWARSVSLAL